MTDIDAVAEAILATMEKHRPRRIRRAELDSIQYEECQEGCKYELGGTYEHLSKLSAQAAIDALQLTEETHNLIDPAWHIWQERIVGVERRLVSPWVRVEER